MNRQIAIAPSGSGKSHMIAALMVMIAIQNDNARFLIVYNQQPMLTCDISFFKEACAATATGAKVRFIVPEQKG